MLSAVWSTERTIKSRLFGIVRVRRIGIETDNAASGGQSIDVNRPLEIGKHCRTAVAAGRRVAMPEGSHRDVVPTFGELRGVDLSERTFRSPCRRLPRRSRRKPGEFCVVKFSKP